MYTYGNIGRFYFTNGNQHITEKPCDTIIILIIKLKVLTFPIVVIFFHGCVPERVLPSYAVGYTYISRDRSFLFRVLLCNLMIWANNIVRYGLMVILPLFAHSTYSLSSLCRRIRRYRTSKMSVRLRVSKIKSVFSVILHTVCLRLYFMMIVIIRVLYLIIFIETDVWPICHCSGLGHETMVCAVSLFIFLSLWKPW